MVFSSTVFLFLFLPALLALYYLPYRLGIGWRNAVLLLGSLLFYAWGEPTFVFVMLAEIAANWFCALFMDRAEGRARKAWLAAAISVDVGMLVVYKYLGFLHRNVLALCGSHAKAVEIALPIGISFFTFQIMSYAIDLYRRKVSVQKRPDDLCLYVALFPQLIAGPIVRYADVEDAIRNRRETFAQFSEGVCRFVVGLGKKVLLANYLAVIADNLFLLAGDGRPLSAATAWIGLLAYTLQIYFDFSGYSDMAIGLGAMFGFRFNENFDHPYAATSVTDFWRRWHISLSSWFRDYVYIPLGGNRRSRPRVVWNLFVVWLLTGVWHGANWTFVAWGLAYFLALLLERSLGLAKSRSLPMRVWTILVVTLCWALFRSPTLPDAGRYVSLLFGAGGKFADWMAVSYLVNGGTVLLAGCVLALPVAPAVGRWLSRRGPAVRAAGEILRAAGLGAVLVASVLVCFKSAYNPFIYFNF